LKQILFQSCAKTGESQPEIEQDGEKSPIKVHPGRAEKGYDTKDLVKKCRKIITGFFRFLLFQSPLK
jgi:hypothetical protein